MNNYDETPAIGLNIGNHEIPAEDPLLYIQTADARGFGPLEEDQGFEYTATWQHDIDESAFEELFHEYAQDGEIFEARTPRTLRGYQLPITKKVGLMGVSEQEPPHQVDRFDSGDFILSVESADTDPLRYYFPETTEADVTEQDVLRILEQADVAIEEDAGTL